MENPAQPCGLWLNEVLPCSSSERRKVTSSTRRGYRTCCALRSRMQWLFTLRGAPFIGRWIERGRQEDLSPKPRVYKGPIVSRSRGRMPVSSANVCSKSLLTERGRVGACMGSVTICQEICHLAPAFTKAPRELQARQRFPPNGGLAWWKQGEGCSEVSFPHLSV